MSALAQIMRQDLISGRPSGQQARLNLRFGCFEFFWQVVGQLLKQLGVQLQLLKPGRFVDAGHGVELLSSEVQAGPGDFVISCLLYTSPSPRDRTRSRMPSSA